MVDKAKFERQGKQGGSKRKGITPLLCSCINSFFVFFNHIKFDLRQHF